MSDLVPSSRSQSQSLRHLNRSDSASSPSAAREVIDVLYEISLLLNTGLDRNALSLCVSLCENGVNPEALAVRSKVKRVEEQSKAIF